MKAPLPPALVKHRDAIVRLCEAYGVDRLEVFGSAADGRFDEQRSDFDFIATFSPQAQATIGSRFLELADALEVLLGRRVDLMANQPIRNSYLRKAIEASRRDLYVRAIAEAS